jgi:hypothetical protein
MPDTQVQNFISKARQNAEIIHSAVTSARTVLEQYQKLGYSPALIDENAIGDNSDITGAQIDLAMAALNDFITLYAGNAGTYLLEIER